MDSSPLVYIIIVNWNGWQDTKDCLDSVEEQDYPNCRILVIDNGSADRSATRLREAFPNVTILETGCNLGFAGGNNVGIAHAIRQAADYVLLLNNDTVVNDPELLSKLVSVMDADPTIGQATPTIYYAGCPSTPWYMGARYSIWRGGKHVMKLADAPELIDVDYASGCCVMVNCKVIEQVGVLDDRFFIYEEDVDWSLRMRKAGLRVVHVPSASVLHKVSKSARDKKGRGAYSPTVVYYKFRNRVLIVRKHGSTVEKYLLAPVWSSFKIFYHFAGYLLLQRWAKLRAMCRGLKDGLILPLQERCESAVKHFGSAGADAGGRESCDRSSGSSDDF